MAVRFRERLSRIVYFFPFQLIWVQLKKSQGILLIWILLLAYVTKNLSFKYGIPHLFLYPEYLGKVDFLSHMIVGFCCGIFIMSYNISTYIINGYRFPFIATLSRPFVKFCYNNSLIPWAFTFIYLYNIYDFQSNIELEPNTSIALNILGYLIGNILFIGSSTIYFVSTNKNIFSLLGNVKSKKEKSQSAIRDFIHRTSRWEKFLNRQSRWKIETYLTHPFKVALARSSTHYNRDTLNKVFSQNHVNASVFEIVCVIGILVIGLFKDYAPFVIPASASIFLLFAIILMLASAVHSWFKAWSFSLFVLLFFFLHYATTREWISYENKAFGMNYNGNKANYSEDFLSELAHDKFIKNEDVENGIVILENWKKRLNLPEGQKPKIVLLNTSGGGLRSMMWTTLSLLKLDKDLDGRLMPHIQLITGSSGGMIGAAFVRELYLNSLQPDDFQKEIGFLSEKISRDILNPVTLNLVTGDLFFKYQTFNDGEYTYFKDRAFAFENVLNENVSHLFDKRLEDYSELEKEAIIPMMIFAPTIINDGRRLIISSQPVSYMTNNFPLKNLHSEPVLENVEFQHFFREQDARNIRFTSILRMNATFPYILPAVTLPSKPKIKIMDSGIRDNYGLTSSLKYLYTFRDWINENTSGVIILQLRDKFKKYESKRRNEQSLLNSLTSPLDNFYSNWTNVQTFEQDQLLQYASSWYKGSITVVPFQLKNDPSQRISLSWHLTNSEKERIMKSLLIPENQSSADQLNSMINN